MTLKSTIVLDENETKLARDFYMLAVKVGCELNKRSCDDCEFYELCDKGMDKILPTLFPNASFMITEEDAETPM